ncbi:MAG: CarD family transcriptional regulator [Acidiferrobacterales bacterium]
MSQNPRFKVGDAVFYPAAGVGRIEAIEELFLTGRRERCFVIRVRESNVTIKVPQANMAKNGIRPLVDGRKLKELFKVLSGRCQRRATGNLAERCRGIAQKVQGGSPLELGEVVRDLSHWKIQTGLSFDEMRLLETACNYLCQEIAAVEGISPDDAFDRIQHHVGAATEAVA